MDEEPPPAAVPALPAPHPESASRYAKGTEGLRSTAKWLLAAFAGIGAVLVASVQITQIGALDGSQWPRLLGALAGLTAGLVAVGYMVHQTARVLTDDWVTLAELSNEAIDIALYGERGKSRRDTLDELTRRIEVNRQQLYFHVAPDLPALHRAVRTVNTAAQAIGTGPGRPSDEVLWAVARSEYIRCAATQVTDFANYHRTSMIFTSLKRRLAVAGFCVAAAIVLFAYCANPPAAHQVTTVQIVDPVPG